MHAKRRLWLFHGREAFEFFEPVLGGIQIVDGTLYRAYNLIVSPVMAGTLPGAGVRRG